VDEYQKFIASSRYARWRPEDSRRETWSETVKRYTDYWDWNAPDGLSSKDLKDIQSAIEDLKVMPSMRCLMTAGPALTRDNVAGFNCAYLPIDNVRAFDETMYILMCGTGVGFSVEQSAVDKLPMVAEEHHLTGSVIVVADSKIGWATSLKELLAALYAGSVPSWDVSKVRPPGARLKTFGGRASGPQPLVDLFEYAVATFRKAAGRRLTALECHDLVCKIAEVIVVGGVRRSALISLSDPNSFELRGAKTGLWWLEEGQRALANNSAAYTHKPTFEFFLSEMKAIHESKSGERGMFSRLACESIVAKNGRRETGHAWGTNPCSEIILRPNQFCNLTEVVIRPTDTIMDLTHKVRVAAIMGTLQATLTNFRYLRKVWSDNTAEEALLGLSLTGIMDHPILSKTTDRSAAWLEELRTVAICVNREYAERLGIKPAAAITCVKPSGTVSQLVNSASGIHPRFAPYYIRTVRADKNDPLAQYMEQAGFPCETDVTKDSTLVFSFPVKAPKGKTVKDVGALEQLKLWKHYQQHWCEHKPSITVYYTDDEFFHVCAWMWDNFDLLSGISLLPVSEHTYAQAPYQEITHKTFEAAVKALPSFNVADLEAFESEDQTIGSQELACAGGSCELP
jgi:ribonucleoside-triphosphate reductase